MGGILGEYNCHMAHGKRGEHMSAGTFEGVSKNGQLDEALAIAIAAAVKGLKTDLVRWTLREVSGEHGGSALVHNLKVTIDVAVDPDLRS